MKNILTLSNSISLLRIPLAFLFMFKSIPIRLFSTIAAMLSDYVDGYLARKFKNETLKLNAHILNFKIKGTNYNFKSIFPDHFIKFMKNQKFKYPK